MEEKIKVKKVDKEKKHTLAKMYVKYDKKSHCYAVNIQVKGILFNTMKECTVFSGEKEQVIYNPMNPEERNDKKGFKRYPFKRYYYVIGDNQLGLIFEKNKFYNEKSKKLNATLLVKNYDTIDNIKSGFQELIRFLREETENINKKLLIEVNEISKKGDSE